MRNAGAAVEAGTGRGDAAALFALRKPRGPFSDTYPMGHALKGLVIGAGLGHACPHPDAVGGRNRSGGAPPGTRRERQGWDDAREDLLDARSGSREPGDR